MVNELSQNWFQLFSKYCSNEEYIINIGTKLIACYSEPHRQYHTLQHISDFLNIINSEVKKLENPELIYFAIWFHDAVYIPENKNNEIESAQFAMDALQHSTLTNLQISYIVNLINATSNHNWFDNSYDSASFLDTDLAILGAEIKKYDEYSIQIREEFISFSDEIYYSSRKKVLEDVGPQ